MGNKNEEHSATSVRNGAIDDAVAEPCPEECLAGDLKPTMPPGGAPFRGLVAKKVLETQDVQIESAEQ